MPSVATAFDVARLYDELRECVRANDQEGVKRVFGELVAARRCLEQLGGYTDAPLDVSATVEVGEQEVSVTLDKRAHNPYLVASRLTDQPTPMPWFGGKRLLLRFA